MRTRPTSLSVLFIGLACLLGNAAAREGELLPVWKRSDGEAHVRLSTPKAMPNGLVSVSYQLVAVNKALATPEMAVARFTAVCKAGSGEPVQLAHSHTTMFKLVKGTFVRESDEPVSPPMDVALDSHHEFAAMPAVVACTRAVAIVKAAL